MKKIKPGEEFDLNGNVFTYSINEDKTITLKKGRVVKSKEGVQPPTLDEVKAFFKSNGYKLEAAEKFYNYYKDGNPPWSDSNGKPVKSWKQKARVVWFKDEYREPKKEESTSKFLF
jgi:signal recognition particle subunit SEC65